MSIGVLLRGEWFKLRGRRVVWVLFAVVVAFAAIIVFIRFGDYQFVKDRDVIDEVRFIPGVVGDQKIEVDLNCTELVATGVLPGGLELPAPFTYSDIDLDRTVDECRQEIAAIRGRIQRLEAAFVLPTAIGTAVRWTAILAVPFFALLTVMIVGSEYGWGTLRSMLMRGPGRWRVLTAKLLLVGLTMIAAWLVMIAVIIVSSVVATALSSGVSHGDWSGAVVWGVVRDAGRVLYVSIPYVTVAALLSVLFSSFAGGTLAAAALAMAYFFVDIFSVGRLLKLFETARGSAWVADLAEYDLGWNSAAWLFGRDGEPIPGFQLASAIGTTDYPGDEHAFLLQMIYAAVFLAAAFWLFRRRDVAGPSG